MKSKIFSGYDIEPSGTYWSVVRYSDPGPVRTVLATMASESDAKALKRELLTLAVEQPPSADMYRMLNTDANERRRKIIHLIGNAVRDGNQSYPAEELGAAAVEALEDGNYEVVWLGPKA